MSGSDSIVLTFHFPFDITWIAFPNMTIFTSGKANESVFKYWNNALVYNFNNKTRFIPD